MPKPSPILVPSISPSESDRKQRDLAVSGASVESSPPKKRRRFSASEKLRLLKAAEAAVASSGRYEIVGPSPFPSLRMHIVGDQPAFTIDGHEVHNHIYRIERDRGYDHIGALWSPGYFRADLANGRDVTLTASTESWEALLALSPEEALEERVGPRGEWSPDAGAVDRALLERYVRTWEGGDLDAIIALLHDDVTLSMPPSPTCVAAHAA